MRIAIVHYHLQRGGVTRVIANALAALKPAPGEAVILSSTFPDEPFPCPVGIVPGLAYCREATPGAGRELAEGLLRKACHYLGEAPDIWHLHNHSLGKNVVFPEAVQHLRAGGARLVLQIHDFAEDGRPANYERQRAAFADGSLSGNFHDILYPSGMGLRYAVLTRRDAGVLRSAGLPENQLVLLPNPVTATEVEPDDEKAFSPPPGRPLILYPTRAIRRKNLGELLLLARVYPEFRFATTLAPRNPEWFPIYEQWKALAGELNLDIGFALGEENKYSFGQLIRHSRAMVTTSVGEGFGLAFLEPWLFGKPLCGRDLPAITADFAANGIRLPACYSQWRISTASFDREGLHRRYREALRKLFAAYERPFFVEEAEEAFAKITGGGSIDFGHLDEKAQEEALRQRLETIFPKGFQQQPFASGNLDAPVLSHNRQKIEEAYSLSAYGARLQELYDDLLDEPVRSGNPLSPEAILDAFLAPENLRLLRT